MSTRKPRMTRPTPADVDRAKIAARRRELAPACGSAPTISDTDRIDALITLFGGHYAFPVMWEVADLFQHGRDGLDAFLATNPSLLQKKAHNEQSDPT